LLLQIISTYNVQFVKKVMLDYNPQVKKEVGPYAMRTSVTTVKDGKMADKCYEIIITVKDTDECTYSGRNPEWMHKCDASTTCVNTQGSYYCACKEGEFAIEGSGGKCTNEVDSVGCCGPHDKACRESFKCHSDKCAFNNCDSHATCLPSDDAIAFDCECKDGFLDTGVEKGQLRGRECVATDHCAEDKCPNGCRCESVTNSKLNGYFCHPMEHHLTYYPESEEEWESKPVPDEFRLDDKSHLCLDQRRPPSVVVVGANPMQVSQGSKYVDPGVTIVDEDSTDLKRRFTTVYDEADHLNHRSGFVKTCGSSNVTYTLLTPWIKNREEASATRTVEVVDVDECAYAGSDPDFVPLCTGLATCQNLACGAEGFGSVGYDCLCHDDGYVQDGARGCADKRPPVIECESEGCGVANIFVFKGDGALLEHPLSKSLASHVVFHNDEVTADWLQGVIDKFPSPQLKAYDVQPQSGGAEAIRVDLTEAITKGSLTPYDENNWIIPFHVTDADGNDFTFNAMFQVTVITPEKLLPLLDSLRDRAADAVEPAVPGSKVAPFGGAAEEDTCTRSNIALPTVRAPRAR